MNYVHIKGFAVYISVIFLTIFFLSMDKSLLFLMRDKAHFLSEDG